MRIDFTDQAGGGIQFIITAENQAERLVLKVFGEQAGAAKLQIIATGYRTPIGLGPETVRIGTAPGEQT